MGEFTIGLIMLGVSAAILITFLFLELFSRYLERRIEKKANLPVKCCANCAHLWDGRNNEPCATCIAGKSQYKRR